MNANDILLEISSGRLDKSLDDIRDAVTARLSRSIARALRPGDAAFFAPNVNPAYLRGKEVIVRDFGRTRIKVVLKVPEGRFQGIITCKPNQLRTTRN